MPKQVVIRRVLLILQLAIWGLLGFQLMLFVHEISHVLMALLFQVELTFVDLFPGRISSTFTESSPYESLIVWSGILFGSALPFVFLPLWDFRIFQVGWFLRLWACFCLLANGLYLTLGIFESLSDSGKLIQLGWPCWAIFGVGILFSIVGYVIFQKSILRFWKAVEQETFDLADLISWVVFTVVWIGTQFWIALLCAK